jgi:hypothetical protein
VDADAVWQTSQRTRRRQALGALVAPTSGAPHRRRPRRSHGTATALGSAPQKPGGNLDYAAFATRIIRADGRRIAQGDIEALPDLLDLAEQLAADR